MDLPGSPSSSRASSAPSRSLRPCGRPPGLGPGPRRGWGPRPRRGWGPGPGPGSQMRPGCAGRQSESAAEVSQHTACGGLQVLEMNGICGKKWQVAHSVCQQRLESAP